jgi:site-specific DNA-methyltransferase (adenine-specific)
MIGSTYSTAHYDHYKENGDINYFEEVVDAMILDGIEGMNESFRNAIMSLDRDKKRMTILSLLDKDLNLFKRIKALTDKNINKMDHIKDIILMLREYVKVSDVEKKKFGEVMTPLELIKEMLATLPEEVWSNPNLKWLDPANGTGPYPIMVIYKLMKGLEEWEPDSEKRYKHIVENMIYVCELQPKNMFLYMCAIDPFDSYKLNIYTGSFLEKGFDFHMKEVWGIDKFDLVIGNPPYNTDANGDFQTSDLYDKFVINSMSISDYILMITPARWMNKNDKSEFRKTIVKFGIEKLIFDKNINFFENTNISGGITYFLLKNEFKGDTIFNNKEVNLKKQLDNVGFLMDGNTDILNSILLKLSKYEKLDNFNSQGYFGLKTNHQLIQDNGLKVYFSDRNGRRLKLEHDGNSYYTFVDSNIITDVRNKISKYKVITPSAYGYKTKDGDFYHRLGKTFISQPNEICTESYVFFDFNSELECNNFIKYLNTNLVKYLISIKKIKQHVTSKIFELVPKISFEFEINNEYLYKLFELSESEIEFLENQKL